MHHRPFDSNNFFYSAHHIRTFRGNEYATGWRETAAESWRDFALRILNQAWSPIVWNGGRRAIDNFLYSDICALDFDEGMTLEQATKTFCDMQHFIGTTRSHQRAKHGLICDRFRVVMPWSRRIDTHLEYEYNLERQQQQFDSDSQAIDGARIFWPCTKIVAGASDGYLVDVLPVPDGYVSRSKRLAIAAANAVMSAETGTLSSWSRALLLNGAPKNSRNRSFYGVAIELAHLGHTAADIFSIIRKSPISGGDPLVTDKEIVATIHSAFKARDRDLKLLAQESEDAGKEKESRARPAIPGDHGCHQSS